MFTIEKNVPIPPTKRGKGMVSKWAFLFQLEPGDSFFVPASNQHELNIVRGGISKFAYTHSLPIVTRALDQGLRVWKTGGAVINRGGEIRFPIEKGIPIPPTKWQQAKYNWSVLFDMEPGDSFFIPTTKETTCSKRGAVSTYAKNKGIRVTTRAVAGGLRVWKLSEPMP